MKLISALIGCSLLLGMGACTQTSTSQDYTNFVNPFIGTGGHGHTFLGVTAPFGAVQIGPNNINKGWDWCSGYHYSDSIVIGFSHLHLNGTGCSDTGDILFMHVRNRERNKTLCPVMLLIIRKITSGRCRDITKFY